MLGIRFDSLKTIWIIKKGDIVEVAGFWSEGINYIGKGTSTGCYFNRVELVESKPTKNQRITVLENEVAELKLIVHELRDKKTAYTTTVLMGGVPVDINNAPEIQLKAAPTVNQQRAAIIEKAKAFIEDKTVERRDMKVYINRKTLNWVNAEFIINEKKRTVVCLIRWTRDKSLDGRGVAKCNPNDVFNEHIGKAIALGRALGLDVSEFEQAVQPTKAVNGQLLTFNSGILSTVYEVINVNSNDSLKIIQDDNCKNVGKTAFGDFSENLSPLKIINDTNAIYEVGS